jgi:hypothetical protein
MQLISVISHQQGASTSAAIALARALAGAGHQVSLREGGSGVLAIALDLDPAESASIAPRLSWLPAQATPEADVVITDEGSLDEARLEPGSHVVFALPATPSAVRTLGAAAQSGPRALAGGKWLGLMVVDEGDEALTASLAQELSADVLGTTVDACAGAVSTMLQLFVAPPSTLADLVGMKLAVDEASAPSAPATSQYTFVMDAAAGSALGASAPLTVPSQANAVRAPAPGPVAPTEPVARRFGLVAVAVPWVLVALLVVLHLVRG